MENAAKMEAKCLTKNDLHRYNPNNSNSFTFNGSRTVLRRYQWLSHLPSERICLKYRLEEVQLDTILKHYYSFNTYTRFMKKVKADC